MSFNLIESVKEVFSGEMTYKLAGLLGENSEHVQKALQGIIPSILTGVLLKADSGDVQETLNLATEANRIDNSFNLNSMAGGMGNSKGMDFLKILFGEKTTSLSDAVAEYSGVSGISATALLSTSAPAVLGVLGRHILDSNMNASGLKSFLNSQKKKVLNEMPASVFLEGIMGFEDLSGVTEKFFGGTNIPDERKSRSKWVLPVILCVIALVAVWYFMNKNQPPEAPLPTVMDSATVKMDTSTISPVPEDGFFIKLPDGAQLNTKKGGIEEQLFTFLNDPNSKPSRRFQFSFDHLSFNNSTSTITNESMVQVQNVALILKAYPKAKIKIGGFNEKGGDSVANKTLSENRASSVAAAMKAAGVNPKQIAGVEGFGSDFAKYPAEAADSLREKDRRISISIRTK